MAEKLPFWVFKTGTVIDWDEVVFNGLPLKEYMGGMYETWYNICYVAIRLDISPIITHRYKYTDYQEVTEVMASGKSGKVVLDWKSRPGD